MLLEEFLLRPQRKKPVHMLYDLYRENVTNYSTSDNSLMNFLHSLRKRVEIVEGTQDGDEPLSLLRALSSSLVQIFKNNLNNDRITVPLMRTLQIISAEGVFSVLQPPKYAFQLYLIVICYLERIVSDFRTAKTYLFSVKLRLAGRTT